MSKKDHSEVAGRGGGGKGELIYGRVEQARPCTISDALFFEDSHT